MEREFNEMEMMSSPLAESEDSLISEMSTRNDFARASYLEYKTSRDGDDEMEYFFPPPPIPKDYSRLRNQLYRKKNEEYYMPRSRSYDRSDKYQRNAKKLIGEKKKKSEAIYATPQKKKPLNEIEEFAELPKYVKGEASTSTTTPPTLELGTEVEFSSKVTKVEEKLKALKLAREDSLSNLLKKQLKLKEDEIKENGNDNENEKEEEIEEKEKNELPGYVEPKDPIIKELQEFLNIEPLKNEQKTTVQSNDHKLVVKEWQFLMKSPSQSTTSSTTSTTTTTV